MQTKRYLFLILFLIILALPLISAYTSGWGGFGYYRSPMDYLQNDWVIFGIIFILFFTIIYYTTNKSFKNPPSSAVIAAALSLFIAMALAQRGWLNNYIGGELGGWVLLGASLIGIGYAVRFAYESFGRIGIAVTLFIIWFIIHSLNPFDVFPAEVLSDLFLEAYDFLASYWGLLIVIIVGIAITKGRRDETYGESLLRSLGRRRY